MRIRTVLVDDEAPARDRLRALLSRYGDLEIVGEACDGPEAVETIGGVRPDLIFLDIEMPGLSGIEVAASLLPPRPRVIFCTAYDQYAIDAFEHHAADYLLKPVNRGRLERALDRVRGAIREQHNRRREVEDAIQTQARLLPQTLPPQSTLDYAGTCRPARGVGGDYYDFLALSEGALGLAMADVAGKGMFAGLLMASLQARLQSLAAGYGDSVDELVREINRLLYTSTDIQRYATFFYGVYHDERRELSYVNAGHAPPLVLRRGADSARRPLRLDTGGTVVGLLAEADYRRCSFRFEPGDLLCLYTDGVSETIGLDGAEYGERRLEQALQRHAVLPAKEICRGVLTELDRYRGEAPQQDDVALIVGKVR